MCVAIIIWSTVCAATMCVVLVTYEVMPLLLRHMPLDMSYIALVYIHRIIHTYIHSQRYHL